ncbi:hypothetical protein LRS10_20330 [Phenylobacterium sp. J426]|uniref:hypothetical protein n=1 Tax=Phenylobacterium sp. J426 TaxID=2898439 RepID=UPI002151BC71|nr:hypothetical protein [Phenylobacterium sp. J426]MCR5876289.1 hypothetical protein [Phenylobacterium sp. J426]
MSEDVEDRPHGSVRGGEALAPERRDQAAALHGQGGPRPHRRGARLGLGIAGLADKLIDAAGAHPDLGVDVVMAVGGAAVDGAGEGRGLYLLHQVREHRLQGGADRRQAHTDSFAKAVCIYKSYRQKGRSCL